MSGKLSNFVAGKTANAQPQPQNTARLRESIAAQSRIKVVPRPGQQRAKQPHIPRADPFVPSEYGESTQSKAEVLVEDSQLDEHGRLFSNYNKYRRETQEVEQLEFDRLEDVEGTGCGEDEYYDQQEEDGVERIQDRQMVGDLQMSYDMQYALDMQRGAQTDPFGVGPGSNYPTTTTGGPDQEEESEECSSLLNYPEEHVKQPHNQYQLVQPPYVDQRDIRALHLLQSRHPQVVLRVEDSNDHVARDIPHHFVPQATMLSQSPSIANATPQQGFRHVSAKDVHRSTSVPLRSQQPTETVMGRPSIAEQAGRRLLNETQRVDNTESPRSDNEACLDYESETLKIMNYDDLRSQSFDLDPSAGGTATKQHVGLSDDELQNPLFDRLALVRDKETEQQQAFFASLPIDEWEEAGDWFLEQFGDIMRKMRDERKQKRKLAKGFEDEISKRHEHVATRKRDITDAMDSMQANGQEILRGSTPKKSKNSVIIGISR
jgi:hypothetical protein